jgi:protease-4
MSFDPDVVVKHLELRKSRRRWRWIAGVALALLLVGLISKFADTGVPREDHVARVFVTGLITGDDPQLQLIRDLREAPQVKAMILRINSPGGTTAGSEALYEELRSFAAKKPMVAVMDTVAASGGYIAALSADHIVARGNTITGSIGVIFSYPEVSVLLNSLGVKMEELKSGELKAEPSPYKPASEKAKAVSMAMVQDGFEWFKGLVSSRRNMSAERTSTLADGRVYTGRQALKEGLIDAIGSEDTGKLWLMDVLTKRDAATPAELPVITRKPPEAAKFGLPLGKALLGVFGLDGLLELAATAKLDGMLVLWHPEF